MARRTRWASLAGAVLVLVVSLGGDASGQSTVTPGAFCSTAGATGVTVTGLAMVCSTTATDPDQLRWRQAGTVTTTTTATPVTAAPVPANQTGIISITPAPPTTAPTPALSTGLLERTG